MTVMHWSPARDLMSLREAMDRLFEESFVRVAEPRPREGRLPIDAYTTPEEIVIVAPLPGVNPDDVEITLDGDTLTIRAELPAPLENVDYIFQERAYGTFSRTLTLNVPVDRDQIEATFQNGLLTLTLPKAEAVRPKTIKVKAKK
ncbi:MAG: Hsp20/alpha crystallin family protein [Chloroflexi bacterium]|nr:MAG: Hsp20/alpha crystallin family protein [Chloroflexota bacterium]